MEPSDLKVWRQKHKLTQRQLAGLLGVTPMCVAYWEWGKRRIPSFLPLALEALEIRFKKGEGDGSGSGVPGVQTPE